jgi:hypothetical protein
MAAPSFIELAPQLAAALAAGEEWAALRAELEAPGFGGALVAALAARALAAAARNLAAAAGLLAALEAVCWEKLHLGTWREVAPAWRDAYALACLLAAARALAAPGAAAPDGGPPAAAAAAALRHLDLAALMGGPRLRALVDAAAADAQARWGALQPPPAPADDVDLGALAPAAPVPLPPRALGPAGRRVALYAAPPSLRRFAAELLPPAGPGCAGAPARLRGALAGWPALARWRSAAYWRAAAGPRTVPVELGAHYLAEGWGQRLMPFSEFLDAHLLGRGGGAAAAAAPPLGYLAQHALLEQLPALAADARAPEYCALGASGAPPRVNAWLGPAGTVTPPHTDPYHNLLCQVVGRKYVRLWPPAAAPAMYAAADGLATNTSRVDLDAPAAETDAAFPAHAGAPFWDCVLEAGEALFVPRGWWHYVKALAPSASVSYWWE